MNKETVIAMKEILKNDDIELEILHINGEEYWVYYRCEENSTEFPCPIHGYEGPSRVCIKITEIIGIFVNNNPFQIKRDADLFLLRQILVKVKEIVEGGIICDECLRALTMQR